jgi:mono/diheme cytochrome c family protein
MRIVSERTSPRKLRFRLLIIGTIAVLAGAAANAQDLDQGKSGAKLFADSCVTCHRSAGRLAKGRFRLTLYLFLKDHYASSSSSAWDLASYLESVESAPHGRSRTVTAKPSPPATGKAGSSPRPPKPVPDR